MSGVFERATALSRIDAIETALKRLLAALESRNSPAQGIESALVTLEKLPFDPQSTIESFQGAPKDQMEFVKRRLERLAALDAVVRAECDRCLKPVEIPLAGDFDQRYTWGEAAPVTTDEVEVTAGDLDIERLEDATLDTRQMAIEQIELHAPVRVVCSEACRGLCPDCGADLNQDQCGCAESRTDPRWDALKQFKHS